MLHPYVLPYVGFNLAHVVTIGTLEPGLLTALVTKVTRQVPFPCEDAPAIWIRTRKRGPHAPQFPGARIGCPARRFFVI